MSKIFVGEVVALYAFFFSLPQWQLMLALACMVTFDTVTGILASRKEGHAIESRKLCRAGVKLFVYSVMVSTMHFTDIAVHVPVDWLTLEIGMIAFLTATEAVSILENIGRMGYATPKRILGILEHYQSSQGEIPNNLTKHQEGI